MILEGKFNDSKSTLQRLIKECVEQFRSDLKRYEQTHVMCPSLILLESVDKMVDVQLNQTKQDKKALDRFVRQYKKLNEKEKVELVNKLKEEKNEKGYI